MKEIKELADKAGDAFGIRTKHQKRFGVVIDILSAVVCFWRWFKDEKSGASYEKDDDFDG